MAKKKSKKVPMYIDDGGRKTNVKEKKHKKGEKHNDRKVS